MKEMQGNTSYESVAEIDGRKIFADKNGYFIWEHFPISGGAYYAIPTRLGKTAKEVEESLTDLFDWNYRSWHGEMSTLSEAVEKVKKLPDIQ